MECDVMGNRPMMDISKCWQVSSPSLPGYTIQWLTSPNRESRTGFSQTYFQNAANSVRVMSKGSIEEY